VLAQLRVRETSGVGLLKCFKAHSIAAVRRAGARRGGADPCVHRSGVVVVAPEEH
jgi:hypothetical protein